MMYYFRLFCASLQLMTRIATPARYTSGLDQTDYAKSVVTFPLVGLVIGLCCATVFALVQPVLGHLLAGFSVVMVNAMITGGFHFDGLADTADGLFSSRARSEMLQIMRDSRIGSNGALALIFAILLYILVIDRLAVELLSVLFWVITAPITSRTLAVVLLMYQQTYARQSGLGHAYIGQVTKGNMLRTLAVGLLLITLLTGLAGLLCAALTAGFALGYRALIEHKLAGQTGDTLGAGIVLFEITFLLLAIVFR